MFLRLILVVLLALGATPVAAMPAGCHDMPALTAAPHALAHDHPVVVDHGCIGCAAVGDWLAERVPSPHVIPAMAPLARPAAFAPRADEPPRQPPPRIG